MKTADAKTPIPAGDEQTHDGLKAPHATTCGLRPVARQAPGGPALQRFGVSCHSLGRFMERGHLVRSRPRAVIKTIGDDPDALLRLSWGTPPLTPGR